jgi:hypothetical protein
MKFISIDNAKKLRDAGMRKKDKIFWEGDTNAWYGWMYAVIKYLEERAERRDKVKNSVSVNLEKSDSVQA